MRKPFWKGLRTIDLVIGLFIICMVVVIVSGGYDDFKCRAMQSEAKFSLQEIFSAQQLYFAEHDHYATLDKLVTVDGRALVPQKYYILSDLDRPTDMTFTVTAKGIAGTLVAGEEWTIDHNHELKLRKAACRKN